MSCKCLVNGVVHHFKHHVMQTCAVMCVANVHSWALADSLQAFEHLN